MWRQRGWRRTLSRKSGGVSLGLIGLMTASLSITSCVIARGSPEPPPTWSASEKATYLRAEVAEPDLRAMWAKWLHYACDNEALAGRDTERCDRSD